MTSIILRPVVESDLPVFYEQQADPVATEMAVFPARDREPFMAHWKKIMADDANILRTVLYDGKVAGNMVSFMQDGHREVGYWLGRAYWGRGIATEALRQFLQEIAPRPLFAYVAKTNIASRRVLEKCGFRLHGEDRVLGAFPAETVEELVLILDP